MIDYDLIIKRSGLDNIKHDTTMSNMADIIDHKCDQCSSNFPIFCPIQGERGGGVMYDPASGYIDSIFTRPPFCQHTAPKLPFF